MLKDRLLRGALAGLIGGLWLIGWNLFSYYLLHFAKTTWTEAMSQLILGHGVKNTMDFIVSNGFQCIWNAFIGVIFVCLVVSEKEGCYLGRAIGLQFIAWFIIQAIGTIYHIQSLDYILWQTVLSNWVGITGFGTIMGWLTKRWDKLEATTRAS